MRWGRRSFSAVDLIGDAVEHWWRRRHLNAWEDHARRAVKCAALALVGLALVHVLYPTQREGWLLWLGEDKRVLAHWTAVVLVGVTAIILPLVRYANTHSRWLARSGGVFAVAMIVAVLLGGWNFYAASSGQKVDIALSAELSASSRIQEAESALAALDARTTQALAVLDNAIAETSAGSPTGRSRLVAQRTAAAQAATEERRALQAELREARAEKVEVAETISDPRPIDGFISGIVGQPREAVAVALDLFRSAVFELFALLFVSLGTTAAISRMGAPIKARPDAPASQPNASAGPDEPENPDGPLRIERHSGPIDASWEEAGDRTWVPGHWRKRTAKARKYADGTEVEEAGPVSETDPRVIRAQPAPEHNQGPEPIIDAKIELPDGAERLAELPAPSLAALLERGRAGETLSDDELQRLQLAGLIEQSEDGNWREVEPTTRVAAEFE